MTVQRESDGGIFAIVTGVLISVGTEIGLDWVRGRGIWEGKGNIVNRWFKLVDKETL